MRGGVGQPWDRATIYTRGQFRVDNWNNLHVFELLEETGQAHRHWENMHTGCQASMFEPGISLLCSTNLVHIQK